MAAGDFYQHWQQIAGNKENPQLEFANAIIVMKRFVFLKKLKKIRWKDVQLLKVDLKAEIMKLKKGRQGYNRIWRHQVRFLPYQGRLDCLLTQLFLAEANLSLKRFPPSRILLRLALPLMSVAWLY